MSAVLPEWPLFVFAGVLTVVAAGVFVAIYLAARGEGDEKKL